MYTADEPPTQRSLVQLDAVNGKQPAGTYVEAVPEY